MSMTANRAPGELADQGMGIDKGGEMRDEDRHDRARIGC